MYYLILLLTLWGINAENLSATHSVSYLNRASDSLALVKLYQSTNGLNWHVRWNLAQPINTWYGVELDGTGCVVALRLQGLNLDGPLPVELGNLRNLQLLYLFDNNLTGALPGNIGFLTNLLDLNIESNKFTGEFPASIKNIIGLRYLTISNNQFSGPFPVAFFSLIFLQELHIANNLFTGPIPNQISSLTNLRIFNISNNQFNGNLPESLNQIINLREIYASQNLLSGEIPYALSVLSNLQVVWLDNNDFSGAVPNWTTSPLLSLRIEFNRFNSIPDYSVVRSWGDQFPLGLIIHDNLFTFEDLIPLLNLSRNTNFEYSPQKPIYLDPIFYVTQGTNFAIRLNVDASVLDNNYKWIKDDKDLTITDQNFYQIVNASEIDEGYYSGSIRNDRFNNFEIQISRTRVVVFEPGRCNQPTAGRNCNSAPTFCSTRNLHDYCGFLFDGQLDTITEYYCDSSFTTQNSSHILFIASQDSIVLEVFPRNCNVLDDSLGTYEGMQMAILDDCNPNGNPLYCQSVCTNQPFTIGGTNFIKGHIYQIIIDGCNGNSCEFLIKVIQGKSDLPLILNGNIMGEAIFCPDGTDHYFKVNQVFGASSYLWYINDSLIQNTPDTFININTTSSGNYNLKMRAANACDTTNPLSFNFEILPKMFADTIKFTNIGNDSAYYISFKIIGGTPPFRVKSGQGLIDVGTQIYTSLYQNCKSNYFIEIEDAKKCVLTVSGYNDCGCTGLAGDMPLDTLRVCEGQNVEANGLGNQIIGTGDVVLYIIYSNPDQPIGSLIRSAPNGIFPYDPIRFKFDTPYYISQVVTKNNTQGQFNLRHPCLTYSSPQVVYFVPRPILSAGGNKIFCGTEGTLTSTGNILQSSWRKVSGPGNMNFSNQDSNWTRISVDSMGLYIIELKGSTEYCERTIFINVRFQNQLMPEIAGFKFYCPGQSTILDAGENYTSYLWNTGQTSRFLTVTDSGNYCVSVVDVNSCTGFSCVKVEESTAPTAGIIGPQEICQGRDTILSSNADFFSYQWSNLQNTKSISIDSGGQYCLIVQADNGCKDTTCIQVNTIPSSTRILSDSACFGSDYSYLGSTYKAPGIHLKKLNTPKRFGCDSIIRLTLYSYPVMFISDTLVKPDNGTKNGSISVVIKGGKEPYRYNWSHGANTANVNNLTGGNYTLTVRDANNCIQIFNFVVRMNVATEDLKNPSILQVFPNPNSNNIGFYWSSSNYTSNMLLAIYKADGQLIIQKDFQDVQADIPVFMDCEVNSGIYYLKFIDDQGTQQLLKYVVLN
ncbi:MAG: T9SS type A sorting domain-containing protein [Saprospiraceae bacterium]|nr:T9SS type A sorting domain-containing protein [Saprospiraceae bacterium]